jgi:phosphatidylserine/phosphatidylglycerophosphate/cardiolipin synthase-like enzyme
MHKNVFSYGISDRLGGLTVKKPDGSFGIVDFSYLAKITPMPFKAEWSGGAGIHEHHKFVVTDFSLPSAKVFTGSSNLSLSGEASNGDNLVMIEDPRVATSYAIEALRVFDHLHFRTIMSDAFAGSGAAGGGSASANAAQKSSKKTKKTAKSKTAKAKTRASASPPAANKRSKAAAMAALTLQKPTAISGKPAWFAQFYKEGTQAAIDRKLFSR